MAQSDIKSAQIGTQSHDHESTEIDAPRPTGWMYKSIGIGKFKIGWYASPKFQLGMVAFVCFMCPGMFNALSGLGGGGKSDPKLADDMNTALYSTFAVVGFFAGTFVNRLGVRLALSFGGIGYTIYSISLLVSEHAYVPGFNIFAGALLGVCAGLLWAAQGTIMMSYPGEQRKGRYFAWFWGIFNIGACIGSLIPLGQNFNVKTNATVGDGTYIAFIVLMFFGAVLALFLCDADKIVRPDGSRVVLMKNPSWWTEIRGLWDTLASEPYIVLLFPMFWSSNWFYVYQQNGINAAYFDTRTKSLNGFLYWFAQIVAAVIIGPLLDLERFRRTTRARAALVILFLLTVTIWGSGYAWQRKYTRASTSKDAVAAGDFTPWDWTTKGYVGPMFLYFFYGMYDAIWQGVVYWFMGALGNSGRKLANLAGFYKGLQSAGSAVMWSLDRHELSYMSEYASNFGLLCGSLIVAAPVVFMKIKDTITVEEDLEGTDETLEDVLPQGVTTSSTMRGLSLALLALAQLATAARELTIGSARFTVLTEGSHEPVRAGPLSLGRPVSPPVNLTSQDTLRISFEVFARNPSDVADKVRPHQTFLRFYDPVTEEEGIQPIRVKPDGKAKIDLNMAKPPVTIPATPNGGPLQVWLIIGSFKYQSAAYRLFELYLPRTQPAPQHPDEASFHPLPAIHHTFRPDPKLPPRIISLFFAGAVAAPWVVLLSLLARIPHSLQNLTSPKIAPFVALLAAFEGLLFIYWLKLKLPDVLLYGAILAIPTVVAGNRALGAIVQWRLGEKS